MEFCLIIFLGAVVLLMVIWAVFKIRNAHEQLQPENVEIGWNSYPRPQLKRNSFYSLNGEWSVAGQKVNVPFPLQSFKSGFKGKVPASFTYEKSFQLPDDFIKDKLLLHFGAVDQIAEVYVNKKYVGRHEGGYLPFSFDITEFLHKENIQNVLTVRVIDRLSHLYPYGKQKKRRGGMWYTPVSGIWQTVWMESVSRNYIENVKIQPDLTGIDLSVDTTAQEYKVLITLEDFRKEFTFSAAEGAVRINIENPRLWTNETPVLYHMRIETKEDSIETYFALRTISIRKIGNVNRICLNEKPLFLNGVLDQGYFCDGIYLPSNEAEYERDILRMKQLGFNTLRKHIKIEPEYFYYACDRMGMLVIQDMVNNGHYSFLRDTIMPTFVSKTRKDTKKLLRRKQKEIFLKHTKDTIKHLYNHPCIIGYTIFNEGWGQFHGDAGYDFVRSLDKTRFIDTASGWFRQNKSDVDSEHVYFKNIELQPQHRPMLLSECGGFQYAVKAHQYSKYGSYGYGGCSSKEMLTDRILDMYEEMVVPAIPKGLCGCIYTQLSDVEDEVNGLYTYDRIVCKVEAERLIKLNHVLKQCLDQTIYKN